MEPKERAHLAREILASIENMDEREIEELWLDEAVRRDENLDRGIEVTVRPNPPGGGLQDGISCGRSGRLIPGLCSLIIEFLGEGDD